MLNMLQAIVFKEHIIYNNITLHNPAVSSCFHILNKTKGALL